jgi:hypothetical protein
VLRQNEAMQEKSLDAWRWPNWATAFLRGLADNFDVVGRVIRAEAMVAALQAQAVSPCGWHGQDPDPSQAGRRAAAKARRRLTRFCLTAGPPIPRRRSDRKDAHRWEASAAGGRG